MPDILLKIIICFIAGLGAGLGTGFAGLSAACVITPVLVGFLGMDFYLATAIALASDVLASAVSAITYGMKKNIDFKGAIIVMAFVLVFTVVGSVTARYVSGAINNNNIMNLFSVVMIFIMGIRFIVKPVSKTKESMGQKSRKRKFIESMILGIYIGFIAGFVGAGGGMMLLFALTIVLGYELKTAIGTSVLIMSLTALTGALTHFVTLGVDGISIPYDVLILCIIFTFLFAEIGSLIANKVSNRILNRITGIILVTTAVSVVFVTYLWPLFNQPSEELELSLMRNLGPSSHELF